MRKFYGMLVATLFASATLGACMADSGSGSNSGDETTTATLIKSNQELEVYLRSAADSPLDRLAPDAKQRFLSGLRFSESGLGSFQKTELEALSATEVSHILGLFGVERTASMITKASVTSESDKAVMQAAPFLPDHDGYECTGRGTCHREFSSICTSNC